MLVEKISGNHCTDPDAVVINEVVDKACRMAFPMTLKSAKKLAVECHWEEDEKNPAPG